MPDLKTKSHPRRIVIPGGTGHVGRVLARHFHSQGDDVTVFSRRPRSDAWRTMLWNGRDPGAWAEAIDGANIVINLAGRSVDCRYTGANRREIKASRVDSTRAIGLAIAQAKHPPTLWMNASTATIYRHSLDRAMDEATGEIGGSELGAPASWSFSIDVATSWERAFFECPAPSTRKIALRSSMTMIPDGGGIFQTLLNLVRAGLGSRVVSGEQFMSWVHYADFTRAIEFLVQHEHLDGCVNVCSPHPLTHREFMRILRQAAGVPFGLPVAHWMLSIGTLLLRTETELILKSRRVIPSRLLAAGFEFQFPRWPEAAQDLIQNRIEIRHANAPRT